MMSLLATLPSPPLAILDMLGGSELLVIFLLVLIFFGGEKMPEFAKGLGKVIREFRKAASGVEQEFKKAMEEEPTTTPPVYTPTPTILPPSAPTQPAALAAPPAPSAGEPDAASRHTAPAQSVDPGQHVPTAVPPPGDGRPLADPTKPDPHVDAG